MHEPGPQMSRKTPLRRCLERRLKKMSRSLSRLVAPPGLKLFFAGLQSCETLDEGFRLMLNQPPGVGGPEPRMVAPPIELSSVEESEAIPVPYPMPVLVSVMADWQEGYFFKLASKSLASVYWNMSFPRQISIDVETMLHTGDVCFPFVRTCMAYLPCHDNAYL